jgi:multiple sugar transport system permease protein
MSTLATGKSIGGEVAPRTRLWARWFAGRQGRRVREAMLAYAFLLPAILIIGTFGLFPLLFAAFQSTLRGLNRIVGEYDGLNNYVRAIGDLAYVLGFWLAIVIFYFAGRTLVGAWRTAREKVQNLWGWLIPGVLVGAGLAGGLVFIFRLLPALLVIPGQLRGRDNTPERFRALVVEAWWSAPVQQSFWAAVGLIVAGLVLGYLVNRRLQRNGRPGVYLDEFTAVTFLLFVGAGIGWLTWHEVNLAYATALEQGVGVDIWTQIITISAGFVLLLLSWWLWDSASDRLSNVRTVAQLMAAALLLIAAWVLIAELPRIIAQGDRKWWMGLQATVWYSAGTVPTQLALALMLAVLLFQNIKGRALFRVIFFIPYIAPFVGTAAVFRIIFSARPNSLLNSSLSAVGAPTLQWLNEPAGVFQLLLGRSVELPVWAAGPSLALVVIMFYGIWTFVGFNTVIFLAGLGAISPETYEAAEIDGAGRWAQFRHITLPLLSPTIYFLTLYSVIGTFKAFNHIYVLRSGAALGTTDTASVVIFDAFKRDTRYGYASALAILLLLIILVLTLVNNRIASRRVFYG